MTTTVQTIEAETSTVEITPSGCVESEPIVFSDEGIDALVRLCLAAAVREAEEADEAIG